MSNSTNATSAAGGSAAFSRLSRPGSGRLLTAPNAADGSSSSGFRAGSGRNSAASLSSSSTPASLSPTSPMAPGGGGGAAAASGAGGSSSSSGGGLVPEHRVRPLPSNLGLPSPGGGLLARAANQVGMSPEQQEKRQGLKISFSHPNMRKAAALGFAAGAHPGGGAGGGSAHAQKAPPSSTSHYSLSQAAAAASSSEAKSKLLLQKGAHSTGRLVLGEEGVECDFKAEDLGDLGEIGRGAFGTVNKMVFTKGAFRKVMAVKRIRSTVDEREQKELLMDLDVVMRSNDCPFIVLFFGAIFKEGDCWICMEMMDTSTDKFYKFIYDQLKESIPEKVIGKITVATVRALNYLKEKLRIIHRDVKPSNVLLDRRGNIKLCDFGISGQLVDSIAKTRDAGCRPYMAPERIDPQRAKGYDVRSDVWSLGITLIELATGRFPYPKWNSVFEQLQQVVHGDPPRLDPSENCKFTVEFVNFVNTCLIKEESQRPKYTRLLEHPFIRRSEPERVDVAEYVTLVLERWDETAMDVETA